MRITIEIDRPSRRRVFAVALATLLLVMPGVALANHVFDDVPDSSPYHGDIHALVSAGITAGCGDGPRFCPTDTLTRQQEAAFLHRGLGRVASDSEPAVSLPPLTQVTIAQTRITPGVVSGLGSAAHGWIMIVANASMYETVADLCDCQIRLRLLVDGVVQPVNTDIELPNNASDERRSGSITYVAEAGNGEKFVALVAEELVGGETIQASGSLSVLYVPFDGTGSNID